MQDSNSISQNPGRTYRILAPLGQGGFGTVYRARVTGEGGFTKEVALKVLNKDMAGSDDVAQRLRDEARVLGLIRHRAIVHVDGLVMLDGRWAVVMEYVEGVDLHAALERGPIPLGPALEILAEVAAALHVAYHATGPDGEVLHLLHRDIKPSNVQITKAGEVKVLDYGIARANFDSREAETRSVVYGSVNYMAPERLDFEEGPPGDVYALGCVLYEMLSGEGLGKTSVREVRHIERIQEVIGELSTVVGPQTELLGFLNSMLSYTPEGRPTARDVERTCLQLRGKLGGDLLLRDWAEEHVPKLIATREAMPLDDLSGVVLTEQGAQASDDGAGVVFPDVVPGPADDNATIDFGETLARPVWTEEQEIPPVLPPRRRSRWMWVALSFGGLAAALVAIAVVAVAAVVLVIAMVPSDSRTVKISDGTHSVEYQEGRRGPKEPKPKVEPEDLTDPKNGGIEAPEPQPSGSASGDPPVAPVPDPKPTERPAPEPQPEPTPDPAPTGTADPPEPAPVPDPAPEPTSSAGGQVKVIGGVPARLRPKSGGGGVVRIPGPVPPGRYSVEVDFFRNGQYQSKLADTVKVTAGSTVVVTCQPATETCRVK